MPPRRTPRQHRRLSAVSHGHSDGPTITDFRDRLCSVGPPKSGDAPTPKQGGAARSIVDRLRADFALEAGQPRKKRTSTAGKSLKASSAASKLTDAFTQSGSAIYTAGIDKLITAHTEIDCQIANFSEASSDALATNAALYDNISYPLSKTMCSAGDNPSSIATRLMGLAKYLDEAEGKLKLLKSEWDSCVDAEKEIWAKLDRDVPSPSATWGDAFAVDDIAKFCAEATKFATTKGQMVEEIEQEYKEEMRKAKMEILKTMTE